MADRKITDLTALTTPASADVLPIVDVSEAAAADKNKKITVGELFKGVPDGTAAAPAIAFESDDGNGIFLSTTDTVGIATNGSSRMTVSTTAVTSTLPVIVPDGTAAAPSVAFTGSGTDTGFYSDAANTLAASTGGTNALYIDSSQRVGVGTASPSRPLTLQSDSSSAFGIQADSDTTLRLSMGYDYTNDYARIVSEDVGADQKDLFQHALNHRWGRNNSTEYMRLDSSGRLGIGTSSPGQLLHLRNASSPAIQIDDTTNSQFIASITSADAFGNGSTVGQLYLRGASGIGFTGNGGSSTGMVLDSSNRLGIGTTSPSENLQISGSSPSIRIENTDNVQDFGNINFSGGVLSIDMRQENTDGQFVVNANGNGVIKERMRIDSSGRLLVGTSSARTNFFNGSVSAALQVEGTGNDTSSLSITRNSNDTGRAIFTLAKARGSSVGSTTVVASGDAIGSVEFQGSDGTEFVQAAAIQCEVDGTPGANDMPGRLVFSTTADGGSSPTERFRIKSNGFASFSADGTNPGSGRLGVVFGGATANGIGIKNTDSHGGSRYFAIFYNDANGLAGGIEHNGASTVNYATSSDYRLKENVAPLIGATARVKQLKPCKFNFISEPDRTVDGFIAHEAQEVVPEAVTGTKDAVDAEGNPIPQGIDQSKLVPLLTAALQEAIGEIESLKARLTAAGI